MSKHNMPETLYRASRCCRVLGNPTAYLVLRFLGTRRVRPAEIGEELELSVSAVSRTLRDLRSADLVRYETSRNGRDYWVKDDTVPPMLESLERWVERMRGKQS